MAYGGNSGTMAFGCFDDEDGNPVYFRIDSEGRTHVDVIDQFGRESTWILPKSGRYPVALETRTVRGRGRTTWDGPGPGNLTMEYGRNPQPDLSARALANDRRDRQWEERRRIALSGV